MIVMHAAPRASNETLAPIPSLSIQIVYDAMKKRIFCIMLETAFVQLKDCKCHTLPVFHDGSLVGLLTMDNVGEFIRIQAALRGTKSPQLQAMD